MGIFKTKIAFLFIILLNIIKFFFNNYLYISYTSKKKIRYITLSPNKKCLKLVTYNSLLIMSDELNQLPQNKEYLEKSFLEELNYKIWTTKGARFYADKRLKSKAKMSNISFAIISAYLIIAGLATSFDLDFGNEKIINFFISALSILVLVFSQFENAQDYKLNAKIFHDCSLELSVLYNELRIFKTLKSDPSDFEINQFGKEISERYQSVLRNYQNHSKIDYEVFLINNVSYIKRIHPEKVTDKAIRKIKIRHIWDVYGWYTIMISIPPIFFYFFMKA